MNKQHSKNFFLVFFSLIFLSLSAQAKTIVLGTTEWPPYVLNSFNKGYAYEIVAESFKAAGYDDVKIIFMPWADAEKALNEGQLDGIFPEYYSEKRAKHVIYTAPFSDSPVGFYKKIGSGIHYPNNNPDKDVSATLNGMKKYRFGVVTGYVNLAPFDSNPQLDKIFVDSDLANLTQLYEGKVDLIFIDKYTAEYLIYHKLPSDYSEQLVFMDPPLGYKRLYVAFSKKNNDAHKVATEFNTGLERIKKNGIFAKIIDRDAEIADEHIA